MVTKRKPKVKKNVIEKVKLSSKAIKVFSLVENDVTKRILKNSQIESKRNYQSENAKYLWRKMSVALISKVIEKDLRISTKGNAKNRREWCEKNNAVVVDMSMVTETELGNINKRNKKGKKTYRPENNLRIRLEKISQGKNLGYVRFISDYDFQNDINLDKAHLVYIYKK